MKLSKELKQLDQRGKKKYTCQSPKHTFIFKFKRKEKSPKSVNFDKLSTVPHQGILAAAINSSIPKGLKPQFGNTMYTSVLYQCGLSKPNESILLKMLPLLQVA